MYNQQELNVKSSIPAPSVKFPRAVAPDPTPGALFIIAPSPSNTSEARSKLTAITDPLPAVVSKGSAVNPLLLLSPSLVNDSELTLRAVLETSMLLPAPTAKLVPLAPKPLPANDAESNVNLLAILPS